ncbi:hypothetical protein A9Q74_12835 [Colwellia sp. 39_35_sub15_T18]|nr:hypothetical protein A9Q74_12835 [Colwellia sp. 39_35_sub15_T18]
MASSTEKKTKKKKEAQLVIRLDKNSRDAFVDACQSIDTTASRELRAFINKFLRSYNDGKYDDRRHDL